MVGNLIEIDGSQGEGGGQILRSALALSCVTGRPFRMVRIRALRPKPGLRPQHLVSVRAAAKMTNAQVLGAAIGSSELEFYPGPIQAGTFRFDIGTAGSISLVLQTVMLPALFAPDAVTFHLTGGTHVPFSPSFHYLQIQYGYWLERMGASVEFRLERAGYYPQGNGAASATVHPVSGLAPLVLAKRGKLVRIWGISAVSNLPNDIAERQERRAAHRLRSVIRPDENNRYDCEISIHSLPSHGQGTMLLLCADFTGSRATYFALGAKGKRAEKVAEEAADGLLRFMASEATVDEHAADQILLPLAFAQGESVFSTPEITLHTVTHAQVLRLFLPVSIRVRGNVGEPGEIRISGCPIRGARSGESRSE